jgi:Fe2+ or Zn2+ uptake regulation protein
MGREAILRKLRAHGVAPSAQRLAVAEYVLVTETHPSADEVFMAVRRGFPMISRATVYNTLNLLVTKGLLRELVLAEGRVVFDPKVAPHHHFVDEDSGAIRDIPWESLAVAGVDGLSGFDVREYQVVLRGKLKSRRRSA